MAATRSDDENQVSDTLHSWLGRAIAALVVSFGLAAVGIAAPSTAGTLLAALSLIASVSTLLALILPWQSWYARSRRREPPAPSAASFRVWKSRDFAVSSGNLRGDQAAVQLLLPLAAGALGLGSFALVWHLTIGA